MYEDGVQQHAPLREVAEENLKTEIDNTDHDRLHTAMDVIITQGYKTIHSYFDQWRTVLRSRKLVLTYKLCSKLTNSQHYERRRNAFDKWRNIVQRIKRAEVQKTVDKNECRNAHLIKECKGLVTALNSKLVTSKTKGTFKILKFTLKQTDKMNKIYFNKWRDYLQNISHHQTAFSKLDTLVMKQETRVAFGQYKDQIRKLRRAEVIQVRQKYSQTINENRLKGSIFSGWVSFTQTSQSAKA